MVQVLIPTVFALLFIFAAIIPDATRDALKWMIKRKSTTYYDLSRYTNWELFKILLDV